MVGVFLTFLICELRFGLTIRVSCDVVDTPLLVVPNVLDTCPIRGNEGGPTSHSIFCLIVPLPLCSKVLLDHSSVDVEEGL